MPVIVEKWTSRRSNTLLGFADVLLPQTHLRNLRRCAAREGRQALGAAACETADQSRRRRAARRGGQTPLRADSRVRIA